MTTKTEPSKDIKPEIQVRDIPASKIQSDLDAMTSRKEAIEKRRKEIAVLIAGLVEEANGLKSELAQITARETHINDLLK